MLAYKYVTPDRIDVLKNSSIRFTQPSVLNDPFEAEPCYEEYKEGLIERMINDPNLGDILAHTFDIESLDVTDDQKEYLRDMQKLRPAKFEEWVVNIRRMQLGVETDLNFEEYKSKYIDDNYAMLSLSKKREHPLMWSHYAHSHQGFVIGFDSDNSFFEPGGKMANGGLCDVEYSENRYIVPKDGLTSIPDKDANSANIAMFYRKSVDWAYEQEMRIMSHPRRADRTIELPDGQLIYLYDFPSECVKEIVFGFRLSLITIEVIREICNVKYPHVKLFRATPHERKFDMRVEPFDVKLTPSKLRRQEEFVSALKARGLLND